ncbi:MAG TPA: hypothetical protein VGQ09_20105 [Chitinophagaceae bacterium]|jgi:hypothetical protein|nr:hypothetical protein [Chitinophagaceae bacterium]
MPKRSLSLRSRPFFISFIADDHRRKNKRNKKLLHNGVPEGEIKEDLKEQG